MPPSARAHAGTPSEGGSLSRKEFKESKKTPAIAWGGENPAGGVEWSDHGQGMQHPRGEPRWLGERNSDEHEMRIAYLHQYYNGPRDSGGTRSYEFARRLVAGGHEVHVITTDRVRYSSRIRGWSRSIESGILVHSKNIPYSNLMPYGERIVSFLQYAWSAARKALELKCDIVFASSTPLTIALPAVYASRRLKVPLVLEVRDLWPTVPIAVGALKSNVTIGAARWLERFAYRNSVRIVALSPGMKDGIAGVGYPEERIRVIPNACDLELFRVPPGAGEAFRARFPWLRERPMVVYTGAIGLVNGVDYLVRLAKVSKSLSPEVCYVIVGDGREAERVRQLARDLDVLDKNFYMIGKLPKADMPLVLAAAQIATSLTVDIPEMWWNSANKFFDALASGTPIAVNYGGWQADLINSSGVGLTLDPKSHEQGARELVRAVKDQGWLAQAGKAARLLAERSFSRDQLAKELEELLTVAKEEYSPALLEKLGTAVGRASNATRVPR